MQKLQMAKYWLVNMLFGGFACLLSAASYATIYVVDDVAGVGVGGCTIGVFRANTHITVASAITAAIGDVAAPHTIYICDGTYSEGTMSTNNDNVIGLTVEGESMAGVDITGGTGDIFNVQRDGITFRNLTLNAGRYAFETIDLLGTDFTLDNVTINNTSNDSIRLNANTVTLTDVTINNTGTTTAHDAIFANATTDDTFTATRLTINDAGGYCVRLRGGEPDALVSFTETNFTNCGTQGLRLEAAIDELTIDDITINGTGNNHCMFVQGGDVASNGNVSITNATLTDCGDGGTDTGLFLNVNNGAGGAMVEVSDITVNNSAGRGIYVNNARANTVGDVTFDNLTVNTTVNAEGIYFNNSHRAQVTDVSITDAGTDGLYVRSGDFMAFGVDGLAQNIITGSGDDGIYVSNNGNDNTFTDFIVTNSSDDGIYLNNSKRNTFTNIEIDQQTIGQDGVTHTNNSNANNFDNVNVSNTTGDCVRIDDGNNTDYINSTLTSCGDYGIDASVAAAGENRLYIDNMNISNTRNHGLYLRYFNATDVRLFNITIADVGAYVPAAATVVNGARGIYLRDSSGIQLQNFSITNTLGDGLLLQNTDDATIDISGGIANSITGAGDSAGENGVELTTNSDGNDFSDINIINTFDDGMLLTGTSVNNAINNISITNPGTASNDGIVVAATATGNSFTNIDVDNVVDDCLAISATNTTVTTADLSNCTDMGVLAQISPDAAGVLTLDDIAISTTGDDGMWLDGYATGSSVNVSDVTIVDAGDIGLTLNAMFDGAFNDLDIQSSTRFGILVTAASANNTFGVSSLTNNVIDANEDGIQVQGGSDGNVFSDFIVSNSNDDGVIFTGSTNNTLENSEVINNTGVGVTVTSTATGNTIDNNLILENGVHGAQVFNTGTSSGNTFVDNCFRNNSNVTDGETGAVNNFDDGARGNFWGSLAVDGSGYSESCADDRALDDDICDVAYVIPGAGGSSDNFPLQFCDDFSLQDNVSLQFWKTVLTINDPMNDSNYKAIPGATMRYTLTITNNASDGVRSGAAQDLVISDDLTNEIVTEGRLTWGAGSMVRETPDYDSGAATALTDANAVDDDADFDVTAGNTATVSCGDLNASESCVLTFELDIN